MSVKAADPSSSPPILSGSCVGPSPVARFCFSFEPLYAAQETDRLMGRHETRLGSPNCSRLVSSTSLARGKDAGTQDNVLFAYLLRYAHRSL